MNVFYLITCNINFIFLGFSPSENKLGQNPSARNYNVSNKICDQIQKSNCTDIVANNLFASRVSAEFYCWGHVQNLFLTRCCYGRFMVQNRQRPSVVKLQHITELFGYICPYNNNWWYDVCARVIPATVIREHSHVSRIVHARGR